MSLRDIRRCQVAGWTLFVLSAVLFTVTTARAGDWIGVAASLLFLFACIVFMVPLARDRISGETS